MSKKKENQPEPENIMGNQTETDPTPEPPKSNSQAAPSIPELGQVTKAIESLDRTIKGFKIEVPEIKLPTLTAEPPKKDEPTPTPEPKKYQWFEEFDPTL